MTDQTFIPRPQEINMFGRIATASYFVYFEEARISYLKEMGADVLGNEYDLAVSSFHCELLSRCDWNARLKIRTKIASIQTNGLTIQQQMTNETTGELIASCTTEIVHFQPNGQAACPLPESLLLMLEISEFIEGNEN